jgi:hypothetical protein
MPSEFLNPIDFIISILIFMLFIIPYTKRSYLHFKIEKIRGNNKWESFLVWFLLGKYLKSWKRLFQPWNFNKNIKEAESDAEINILKPIIPLPTDSKEVLDLISKHKKYTILTVITFIICAVHISISILSS